VFGGTVIGLARSKGNGVLVHIETPWGDTHTVRFLEGEWEVDLDDVVFCYGKKVYWSSAISPNVEIVLPRISKIVPEG